jgi:hypothetical protein
VLDGWWVEGYKPGAGWALAQERSFDVQEFQDELDAETIYNILEQEIVPAYYNKNKKGVSSNWASYVKNTISQVAPNFTMRRQLNDYVDRFYLPQTERYALLRNDDYKLATEVAQWKSKIAERWNGIHKVDANIEDGLSNTYKIGESHPAKVQLNLNGLDASEVGVEIVIVEKHDDKDTFVESHEFKVEKFENGIATYALNLTLMDPGSYSYSVRVFPKNKLLPHRFDFKLLHWI